MLIIIVVEQHGYLIKPYFHLVGKNVLIIVVELYYVDHHTRITTWTPPTAVHLSNVAQWQNQYDRSHSMFNQFEHRFLPQTENNTPIE